MMDLDVTALKAELSSDGPPDPPPQGELFVTGLEAAAFRIVQWDSLGRGYFIACEEMDGTTKYLNQDGFWYGSIETSSRTAEMRFFWPTKQTAVRASLDGVNLFAMRRGINKRVREVVRCAWRNGSKKFSKCK